MKKSECQEWVDALRSGDYSQGTENLRSVEGRYCCLGVKAALDKKLKIGHNRKGYVIQNGEDYNYYKFCDLLDRKGSPINQAEHLRKSWGFSLSQMNDVNLSFTEIADKIEKDLLPLCEEG